MHMLENFLRQEGRGLASYQGAYDQLLIFKTYTLENRVGSGPPVLPLDQLLNVK